MSQYISDELIQEAFRSLQNDNAQLKVELVVLQKELAETKAPWSQAKTDETPQDAARLIAELRDDLMEARAARDAALDTTNELIKARGCPQPETDRQKRAEKLLAWAEAKTEPSHGDRFVWELRQAAGLK